MLDITQLSLHIGHTSSYVAIIMIGFFFFKRSLFAHALILVLFTNVYNYWLKLLFKLPLPPTLGHEGFGFPSGHAHSSAVFWGWLAISFKPWWAKIICLALCSINVAAIVHAGFHYPMDVAAAIGFAVVTLTLYSLCLKVPFVKQNPAILGIFLAMISLVFLGLIPTENQATFTWQAQGALVGFSLGWLNLNQHKINEIKDLRINLTQLMIAIAGMAVVTALFMTANKEHGYGLIFIQFFLTGLVG